MAREMISATMTYPGHVTPPEDLLHFIEMRGFTKAWERMGLAPDALHLLQAGIMAAPTHAPVIPATGGLRKRDSLPQSSRWERAGR